MHYPHLGVTEESMLQKDYWCSLLQISLSNSEHCKKISIFCRNWMGFTNKTLIENKLTERLRIFIFYQLRESFKLYMTPFVCGTIVYLWYWRYMDRFSSIYLISRILLSRFGTDVIIGDLLQIQILIVIYRWYNILLIWFGLDLSIDIA